MANPELQKVNFQEVFSDQTEIKEIANQLSQLAIQENTSETREVLSRLIDRLVYFADAFVAEEIINHTINLDDFRNPPFNLPKQEYQDQDTEYQLGHA